MEEDGDLDTAMETEETMEHVVSDVTSKRSCTNPNTGKIHYSHSKGEHVQSPV